MEEMVFADDSSFDEDRRRRHHGADIAALAPTEGKSRKRKGFINF
jgi:hypothetical protein